MNKIIHEITLDFSLPCARKKVYTARYDNGSRLLRFHLTDNGVPYEIGDGSKVILYGLADGVEAILADCDYEGNTVTAVINSAMSSPSATLVFLKILSADGLVLTTPSCVIVNMQSFDIDETIEKSQQYSALLTAIHEAEGSKIISVDSSGNSFVITYADGDTVTLDFEVIQGEKGEKGDKGDPGEGGVKGDRGDPGEDGKSAYQYALDGGFGGTEAEFAELLGGADGRLDTLESQISDILYKAISITSFTSSVGTAVMGSTVDNVTLSWATSKTPVTLTLDGVTLGSEETSKALTGQGITSQKTWTLKATDERGAVSEKTTTLYFRNYVIYMAATSEELAGGIPEDAVKVLSDNKARSFTVNAGEGEYIWYLVPKRLGTCSFKVGGFDGGFVLFSDSASVVNEAGYSEEYYVYVSSNPSLGVTTVEVK